MKGLDLFELVQNLSKTEKRAFKLSAVYQKNESLVFILFDHLCKLKENIHLLECKIKNEKLLKKLPRIKKDLYDRLLDFLASYHEENLIEAKVYKQIRIAKILLKKDLYKQAWKQIIKAKKKAQFYELYNHLLDALLVQREIICQAEQPNKRIEKRSESNAEINEALVRQQKLFEYEQLIGELVTTIRENGISKNPKEIIAYKKALEELPPLKYKGYRFSSQYEYIRSIYFYLIGDIHNAYLCEKCLVEIGYEYMHFIKIDSDRHIMLLFNVINSGNDNNLLEESSIYLDKLELFLQSCSSSLQRKYLPSYWDIQLFYLNKQGEYKKSMKLLVDIEKKLPIYQEMAGKKSSFFNIIGNNIIATCLFAQNNKKALDWINKILNEKKGTLRQDYYINIRFLECIVLIENDLSWLVEAKLRSLRSFLNKNNKLFSLEMWLLSFLRRLICNADSRKKQKELYKNALVELKEHEHNYMLHIFNYIEWIRIVLKNE